MRLADGVEGAVVGKCQNRHHWQNFLFSRISFRVVGWMAYPFAPVTITTSGGASCPFASMVRKYSGERGRTRDPEHVVINGSNAYRMIGPSKLSHVFYVFQVGIVF